MARKKESHSIEISNRERLDILEKKWKKKDIRDKDYVEMKKALLIDLCKYDLGYLVTEILDKSYYKDFLAPVHYEMMDFAAKEGKRKLLLIPRGHFKSSLVTIPLTIQRLLQDPNSRILITSAVLGNSSDFLRSIKGYLESNEMLKALFGEFVSEKWNEVEIVIKQRKKKQIKEASVMASSVDKGIVSKHFSMIIADDLVNRETINTKEQLEKTITYYKDLLDLLDPDGTLIMIGTRWHFDDIYGYVMEEDRKRIEEGKEPLFEVFFRSVFNEDGSPIFPKKFTAEYIEQLKHEKGSDFACTPAETPILLSDFTEKPIAEIQVGDEVIGWTHGSKGVKSKLVKSKVKRVFSKVDTVYNLEMKSGRKVRCTKDHKWYTGRHDKSHKRYDAVKVGEKLMFVCPTGDLNPTIEERIKWNYLAGFFDADGTAKSATCLMFAQSPEANPASYKKLIDTIEDLGMKYTVYERKRTHMKPHWSKNCLIWIKDSFATRLKMIRIGDCAKRFQISDRMIEAGTDFIRERDVVLSMSEDKKETVYAIETETGNYIAWGYASSNSQYLNNPIDDENADFKDEWLKYYEIIPDKTINWTLTLDTHGGGENKNSDFNGWCLMGVDTDGIWWVRELYHDKSNVTEIINRLFAYASKYPYLKIGLEKTMYVNAFYQELLREQQKRGKFLNIVELKHTSTSKEVRIKSLIPLFQNGLIRVHKDMKDFRDEYLRFPKARHDDILDALAMQQEIAERPYGEESEEEIGIYNKVNFN